MIITNLMGGLGNQMFEYAAGLALSKEKGTEHKVDISHFENGGENETPREFELNRLNTHYQIAVKNDLRQVRDDIPLLSPLLNKLNFFLVLNGYVKYPVHLGKDIYLNGYFQNQEYFKKYSQQLISEFQLNVKYKTEEYLKIEEIIKNDENSVAMHIRRGDYISNTNANKHHGVLTQAYYKNACEYLKQKVQNISIYIFSDDIDWVENNMKFLKPYNVFYVSRYKFVDAQELTLMSKCKHNIIANSSFSWWGAWLNQNKNKIVITPKYWLRNGDGVNKGIVPENWIRM